MLRIVVSIVSASVLASSLSAPALAQTPPASDCSLSGADDKCEGWSVVYDDDEVDPLASESPADIVVAPDGQAVYAAMQTTVGAGFDGKGRWAVIRYSTSGEQTWIARWGDPERHSFPTSIAVSPDGKLVYVSGSWKADQVAADGHLTTIAFDSSNGDIVWQANYDGPGDGTDNARDLVVAPDGRTLYIAGISAGRDNGDLDYAAIAYDARSGEQLWVTRWDGIGESNSDSPFAVDLNRRGDMLYMTGWSYGEGEFNNDYGTIAVRTKGPDTGEIAWSARYDGVGVHAPDQASALVVSPDDSKVFVAGMSDDVEGGPPFDVNYGYATVAYDARSGQQLWEMRKQWPETTFNSPTAIAIDPAGERVVVSGQANSRELDFGTVTYDSESGTELWSDRYGFQDYDLELAKSVVMDPRGDTVYITGVSAKSPPGVPGLVLYAPNGDQLTIAYDIATGEKRWLARFNPSTTDFVSVQEIAVSPDAETVYAAAGLDDQNWDNDGDDRQAVLTSYDIGPGIPLPEPPATDLEITGGDERGQYSDVATLAARLTNSFGDPIEDALVDFEFLGRTTSATTDSNGVAEIATTLTQRPGLYPVRATYEGEPSIYAPSAADATFAIEKENVSLVLKVKRGKRLLKATLRDADSMAPVRDRSIAFYVKGTKIGSSFTDVTGKAVRSLPKRFAKTQHGFKALFKGDDFFRKRRSS